MRPVAIPSDIKNYYYLDYNDTSVHEKIKALYKKISTDTPEVTVSIPAYNEETTIIQTLASLCNTNTKRPIEIIVINNNSTDRTEELVKACGINCILETTQGITPARNTGLKNAKGKYVLSADADTIYPKDWIEEMVKPLDNSSNAITYGRFSFIPTAKTQRGTYFFYEYFAEFSRLLNNFIKDEAVNVYGFNSGFRRDQGLSVDSFNHPPGTNEDGWLATKLRNKGFGKLYYVTNIKALVWTTDRRIQLDGGLIPGLKKRIKRILNLNFNKQ